MKFARKIQADQEPQPRHAIKQLLTAPSLQAQEEQNMPQSRSERLHP